MTTSKTDPEVVRPPLPARAGAGRTALAENLRNLLRYREVGILSVLILLVVATSLGNARFLGAVNLQGMELDWSSLAILAAGEAVVIITRNVDLDRKSVV